MRADPTARHKQQDRGEYSGTLACHLHTYRPFTV